MPGLDHTGPVGEGPRTGRGLGNCKPRKNENSNHDQQVFERGTGQGLGRGRGFGKGRGMGKGFRQRFRGGSEQ